MYRYRVVTPFGVRWSCRHSVPRRWVTFGWAVESDGYRVEYIEWHARKASSRRMIPSHEKYWDHLIVLKVVGRAKA